MIQKKIKIKDWVKIYLTNKKNKKAGVRVLLLNFRIQFKSINQDNEQYFITIEVTIGNRDII